jgi:TIR domain
MNTPINPFVCGRAVSPTKFVGRTYEIDRIFDQLNCDEPGSVAISGERKIGKTSLLHYIVSPDVIKQRKVNEKKSVLIFQDCSLISPFTENNFWRKIIRKLYKKLVQKDANPHLIKYIFDLQSINEILTSDIEILQDDMHNEDINFTFFLILDEFEWCVRTDLKNEALTRNFLAGLRALINHESQTLSLVVATRKHISDVCRNIHFVTSPFENNFACYNLRPFSKEDAEYLLKLMLMNNEINFTEAEKDFIHWMAGTHPQLLQIAASLMFNYKASGSGTTSEFLSIREKYLREVKHQFENFWYGSRPNMQQILVCLVNSKEKEANDLLEYRVEDRDRMIDRGIIVKDNDQYRMFSPFFKEWLAQNLYRLGGENWLNEHDIRSGKKSNIALPKPPTIFISYSHKDEKEKNALMVQLGVLQKAAALICLCSDDSIGAGEDWEQKIYFAIGQAEAAILLISANYFNSDYILSKELPKIRQCHGNKKLKIIPIIIKPCAWQEIDWLARMNVWPKNGNPIWINDGTSAEQELATIAKKIAEMIKKPKN